MITTIVPVAPAREAKTRLAAVLDDVGRADLARDLLTHTIAAARPLGPVLVVSRSARMRELATSLGAQAIVEEHPGLNAAVAQGLAVVAARGGTALVLPSDLPRVTTADLLEVVAAGAAHDRLVVVVPCQREDGTNALLLRPADVLTPAFGPASHQHHVDAAGAAGIPVMVHHAPGLVDLDTPTDLARLRPDLHPSVGACR